MSKQQPSKNNVKQTTMNTSTKKKDKIDLSKGGMRSPARSKFGKILLWFLVIAMLSTGFVFLIYAMISAFTRV